MAFESTDELGKIVLYTAFIATIVHSRHNFFICRGVGAVEYWGNIGSTYSLLSLIGLQLLIGLELLHNVLS